MQIQGQIHPSAETQSVKATQEVSGRDISYLTPPPVTRQNEGWICRKPKRAELSRSEATGTSSSRQITITAESTIFFFLASNKLLITLTKYSKKSLRRLQTPSPAGVTVAGEGSVPPAGYRAGASCSNRRLLLKLFRAVPSTGASRRRTEPCFSCVLFPFLINLGVLIDETTADEC